MKATTELRKREKAETGPCDACEIVMINGVRCHEHGCPRYAKLKLLRAAVHHAD